MREVVFPAYKLPRLPTVTNGVLYYEYVTNSRGYKSVIDDYNQRGDSLAKRRLNLLKAGTKLYNFKASCHFLIDLVKLSKATSNAWIDAKGRLFQHRKNKFYRVESFPIKRVLQLTGKVLVELEGDPVRYVSLYGPRNKHQVGLLLCSDTERIFFGFADPDVTIHRRSI